MKSFKWSTGNVSATDPAAMAIRTQIETDVLRTIVGSLTFANPLPIKIADVGSGFGRMSNALTGVGRIVHGFEREERLVRTARKLVLDAEFTNVEELWYLPVKDDTYDLAFTFTVLQHMTPYEAKCVMNEMKRIAGVVVIVEDTEPRYHFVDKVDPSHFTYGRSVPWYEEAMKPYDIAGVFKRQIEPTFKRNGKARPFVGHYMVFRRPKDVSLEVSK